MRIVHFDADSLGTPYAGGQARRTFEINRRLARRHDVVVISAGYRSLRSETIAGVRYERTLPLSHPLNFIWYFAELVPRALLARADVFVEDFSSPFTASGLPMIVRRPVIGVASYLFGRQAAQRYHVPLHRWESAMVSRYRHLVSLTQQQEQLLRIYAPGAEIRRIPNGADDQAFAHAWRGDQTYVAFIGRLDWRMKGLDLLLDSVSELPMHLPLKIAGDGPGRAWLERQIDARALRGRVQTVGLLSGAQRHEFLAHAKALAFPSRYENQSLVGLDALVIGVPIVAFNTPSSQELFGECASLVPSFDAGALGRAIARVAGDVGLARSQSACARARGATFTWQQTADDHERYLMDVVEAPARTRDALH